MVNIKNGDNMTNQEYQEFIKKYTPNKPVVQNALMTFFVGGLMGVGSEILLEIYQVMFSLPRKESGVLVILTLIVVASILTALGVFDILVTKLKSALIIPITGFAHSMTSAALEYYNDKYSSGSDTVIIKSNVLYNNGYIGKLVDIKTIKLKNPARYGQWQAQ